MCLYAVVLLALVTLLASSNTVSATEQVVPDADANTSTRFLRGATKVNAAADSEGRAPNLDIVIKDAATKVKKATIWKLKFVIWKTLLRRTPLKVRAKLGMEEMGREVYSHKNFEMLMAYVKSYGKGPPKYP